MAYYMYVQYHRWHHIVSAVLKPLFWSQIGPRHQEFRPEDPWPAEAALKAGKSMGSWLPESPYGPQAIVEMRSPQRF